MLLSGLGVTDILAKAFLFPASQLGDRHPSNNQRKML